MWRSRWFCDDFARLSYAPLLAFFCASAIGSPTATFVLFLGTVWAAGNLGYSLIVHRLRNGTEPAICALPIPSWPTENTIVYLNFNLHIVAPFVVLLWTFVMVLIVNVLTLTDEMLILMALSYFGCIHVTFWVIYVSLVPMHRVLIGKWMKWFLPDVLPCMAFSPLIALVSVVLAVLCHLLLMMFLVAYLWYNIAVYIHFWETRSTGQMKCDPGLGETPSEAAATMLLSS